ncbi:MAG: dienelactone hydrolase family protein [Bacteroidetes bacterium]|nr:dienelactone hydrolase family protein [Bacteroidota bacterium]
MKNFPFLKKTIFTLLLTGVFMAAFSQHNAKQDKIKGHWSGPLKVQSMELRLVLNVSIDEKDSITVTLDSPDQGAKDIPTSRVIYRNDSLIVEVKKLMGSYRGSYNNEYDTLNGIWKQGGLSFPLVLGRTEKIAEVKRPQEPQPPYPYLEKEVKIHNIEANLDLAGTLTYPREDGIYPAVILITGSGPQNRNEEILGHKPFLLLADWLTRHGIAVLRCDDRGVAKSTGSFSTATTLDFATDVSADVDFMKTQPFVDSTRIGLMGHSEGGIIAPIVASGRNDIDFIVMLAGTGLSGEQILLAQAAAIYRAAGEKEKQIKASTQLDEDIYTILRKNKDNEKATVKIKEAIEKYNKTAEKRGIDKVPSDQIEIQIKQVTSPWFRTFLTLDPEFYLSKVKCPVLALNGELDVQVLADENLQAIEKALIFAGNSRYEIEKLPGLNHLFQTAKTGAPDEYSKIEETISPVVLEKIASWILSTTKK